MAFYSNKGMVVHMGKEGVWIPNAFERVGLMGNEACIHERVPMSLKLKQASERVFGYGQAEQVIRNKEVRGGFGVGFGRMGHLGS